MKLYGTLTSPYVRRVRIVAAELGESIELIDTATPEGQSALRAVSPIWKVPAADLDGALIFDSHAIVDALLELRGPGELGPIDPAGAWSGSNLHLVIDGALDALINLFYLGQDGLKPGASSYLTKQRDRAASAIAWLAGQVEGGRLGAEHRFGVVEIALLTALEWMQLRDTYPVADHPALVAFLAAHADRPTVLATRPPRATRQAS